MITHNIIHSFSLRFYSFFFIKAYTCKTVPFIFVCIVTTQLSALDFSIATSYDTNYDKLFYFPSSGQPIIANCDTAYQGLPLNLNVIFTKYSRTSEGKSTLKFSYKIIKPAGSIIFDTTAITAYSGKTDERKGLLTSRITPQISFTNKDEPGTYKIVVIGEDHENDTTATREKNIVLSAFPKATSFKFDIISFNVWVHNYCNNPDPARAIAAFSYFIASDASNDDAVFWPVFYFFQCLFRENTSLVNKLAAMYPTSNSRLKEYIVLLLRSIDYKRNKSKNTIPDSLWSKFDKAAENGFVEPLSLACVSSSPQVIEFGFYFYGKYSMVKFLIDCLGMSTQSGYETFIRNAGRYGQICTQSIDRESGTRMSENAKKILEKSYSKHSLIHTFCNFALEYDQIDKDSKKILSDMITDTR